MTRTELIMPAQAGAFYPRHDAGAGARGAAKQGMRQALYADHGTHEQFHSEFKTDLDLERLPSGKFDTNVLVLSLAAVAYNILRLIGQQALLSKAAPLRHPAKRRRLKTVMQEMMRVAAKLTAHARQVALHFGRHCPVFTVWRDLYVAWSAPDPMPAPAALSG